MRQAAKSYQSLVSSERNKDANKEKDGCCHLHGPTTVPCHRRTVPEPPAVSSHLLFALAEAFHSRALSALRVVYGYLKPLQVDGVVCGAFYSEMDALKQC